CQSIPSRFSSSSRKTAGHPSLHIPDKPGGAKTSRAGNSAPCARTPKHSKPNSSRKTRSTDPSSSSPTTQDSSNAANSSAVSKSTNSPNSGMSSSATCPSSDPDQARTKK